MIVSLIHPSRGRCDVALKAFTQWVTKSSGMHEIEYIISVDEDDPQLDCYKDTFDDSYIIINQNRSIVDAVNVAALKSTGDLLVVMSDDFECPQDWDDVLISLIPNFNKPYGILIDDNIQKPISIMTMPIINKVMFDRLQYIYHPGYFSMYADNDITEAVKAKGVLIDATSLVFKHMHYTVPGGLPNDDTYRRENNVRAYEMGKKLFEQRTANGFNE